MKIEDYSKYYIQGSDHYLVPKDEFIELFEEMCSWREDCLKNKYVLKQYEDPNDYTLFAMWCTEKVRDENTNLKKRIAYLEESIVRKEETIADREDEIVDCHTLILKLRDELNDYIKGDK